MSFAPRMVASPSNQAQRSTRKALDMDEHVGDSDEANEGSNAHTECLRAEESRSPPKSVHNSRKDKEVPQALAIIHMRDEAKQQLSLTKQLQAQLKQHPQISTMGSDFIWSVMDCIHQKNEKSIFLDLDDEFMIRGIKRVLDLTVYAEWKQNHIVGTLKIFNLFNLANCCVMMSCRMDEDDCRMDEEDCAMDAVEDHAIDTIIAYTLQRNHVDQPQPTFKERLPRAIGGESGVKYIHRLLNENRHDLCRKVLRLDKDVFTHLVNIFMERRLLKEDRFIKANKIVAITLFVLARDASYREAEDRFQHSLSTIGKYHKQVFEGLVKLPSDIIRPYQSQVELPTEILQKKGFYWPFF
ncbi:LOW QUALITY PROTEIN: hypothetical protein Cgig2_001576 [Carnegiea gigantea]|uniref:DUF8040 domain-containing protein n=1 Tax=Carnegiea gigantea TaxID=171969 RepID=A0A9Q1JVL1_9CARY|nr:LOW QUALITY PROTEIN: hypothetical protein Cgig2_001576 [Carnegiea gigantea]